MPPFSPPRSVRPLTRGNRKRMRYSTGVVEAGCKHAIGARLKRAGMHWSVNGASGRAGFAGGPPGRELQ